jgi:membrane protein DedA with SNARE-associated domain
MKKVANHHSPQGNNYLGLSFQIGIFIFLATYGGMKLDETIGNHHIFVILFSLLSIVLSLYYIIHKETHKKKKNE